jgi:hypothetical protein
MRGWNMEERDAKKGPCAATTEKLKARRKALEKKRAEIGKLKAALKNLPPALPRNLLRVRVLVARGSVYDFNRPDRARKKNQGALARLGEHLSRARSKFANLGIKVEFSEPVVVGKGKELVTLEPDELSALGDRYVTYCMPALVFTDNVKTPPGERFGRSGWADRSKNIAGISDFEFVGQTFAGRHIAHNLAHLLGLPDNKRPRVLIRGGLCIDNHLGNHTDPGGWVNDDEREKLLEDVRARAKACDEKRKKLEKELDQAEEDAEELQQEIKKLEQTIKECREKEDLGPPPAEEEPCEGLRRRWPELMRRYGETQEQVHRANEELEKAKEMLRELRRLLQIMDECIRKDREPDDEDFLFLPFPEEPVSEEEWEEFLELVELIEEELEEGEEFEPEPEEGEPQAPPAEPVSPTSPPGPPEALHVFRHELTVPEWIGLPKRKLAIRREPTGPPKRKLTVRRESTGPSLAGAGGWAWLFGIPLIVVLIVGGWWLWENSSSPEPGREVIAEEVVAPTHTATPTPAREKAPTGTSTPTPVQEKVPVHTATPTTAREKAATPTPTPGEAPAVPLSLNCGVTADELVLELSGPPGHYWVLFWSTEAPSIGKGDFLSGEVRLDLTSAHRVEEKGEGQFGDTGKTKIPFPVASFESGLTFWFQAISVAEASILMTEIPKDAVEITEVCKVSF